MQLSVTVVLPRRGRLQTRSKASPASASSQDLRVDPPTARVATRLNERLNLDLRAELHHLPGRHAEEGRGAFGVALQEGEHGFTPHPHARHVLAGDDGL